MWGMRPHATYPVQAQKKRYKAILFGGAIISKFSTNKPTFLDLNIWWTDLQT